jgi:hypothetical protein
MCSELCQQVASASLARGKRPEDMPLTKAGTPMKGGYHNHPCTQWVGEAALNYLWAVYHGLALCNEYRYRYRRRHFCQSALVQMAEWQDDLSFPVTGATEPALAMPEEFQLPGRPVDSYRQYYSYKTSVMDVSYRRGRTEPDWLRRDNSNMEVTSEG